MYVYITGERVIKRDPKKLRRFIHIWQESFFEVAFKVSTCDFTIIFQENIYLKIRAPK